MLEICLLGATGSIGSQVLDLIREKREQYKLVAFSFNQSIDKALEIIEEFEPKLVSCGDEKNVKKIKQAFPKVIVSYGNKGLQQVATFDCICPMVINALVGSIGLLPTMSAIERGRNVYLANKETLVIGGEIVMDRAKEMGVKIIPIDSEHSAIAQIIEKRNHDKIKKLYITASGGAFRDLKREDLIDVTVDDALKHPNWKMGPKITIDCATMMNKGFELIEAHYLFSMPMDKITAILHKESVVHSMVEFEDGSIFAQMGSSDMHLPIKYAMEGPSHSASNIIKPLDILKVGALHFEELSTERYPMLQYAIDAINKGGIYPTLLNAANEAAVKLFLNRKIKFLDIESIVKKTLESEEFENFTKGPLTIAKIMSVDELVKISILSKYQ